MSQKARAKRQVDPTGLTLVDGLAALREPTVEDYVRAASQYVLGHRALSAGQKKSAQIRLSAGLGAALAHSLRGKIPNLSVHVGETPISGALRTAQIDVSEFHARDGLRLAIELKPVNLAVGRAIWNRFGDIRTVAVNLHLKFPFAIVGGVLAVPTFEEPGAAAEESEEDAVRDAPATSASHPLSSEPNREAIAGRRDTTHLVARATDRLSRAGGRLKESDAPHLLEAVCVLLYDPDSGTVSDFLPSHESGLRWDAFIATIVQTYQARFGGLDGE
jgi:hypothetical protein